LSLAVSNLRPRLAAMTRQPCLSSETTASDMRVARLPESNNSSEMSQLKSTLENQPLVFAFSPGSTSRAQ
jgi:hypothetical protein